MEEISFDDLKLKLKTGELNYLNLYNVDLEAQQYRAINHYSNSEYDTIETDQKLSILFHDIEVYSYHTGKADPQSAPNPISAITIFNNFEKTYYCYFLILNTLKHDIYKDDLNQKEEEIRNELLKLGYIKDEDLIKIHLFKNELELLRSCWSKIHEIDPSILTGFYSDHFDLPYIYNRLCNLLNGEEKDVNKILSKFGIVKPRKTSGGLFYQIAEYPLLDIQALIKPRDEGGFNYGKKRASYSLDFLSEVELGLKKIEYKDKGMSLDKFYELDPWGYIKYNIVDVALTARLDEKLKHIDLHNMLRRDMKTPMSTSIRGSSTFFDTTFSYQLDQQGKYFRYGIVPEKSLALSERDIKKIPKPKQNKIKKWTITKVDVSTFTKILGRYPGAYVKDSRSQVIDKNDGIVVDMDASLPPWEKIFIKRDDIIYYENIGDYTWQKGDKTLTWNDKNETCWKEVLGKTEHDWNNELVKITTETGKELTVTTNHSIFGVKQKDFSHTTTQLINAGKLEKGDYVTGLKNYVGLEKVKKIERKNYSGKVYDISVKDTERFFAGTGIGAHNTALYP